MNRRTLIVAALCLLVSIFFVYYVIVNYVIPPKPEDIIANVASQFIIFSEVIKEKEKIPVKYTLEGQDVSPPISWSGVPKEAKSLVLIMYDPDAPSGIFYHWILYNIPANINSIRENVSKTETTEYGFQGVNSYGKVGYGGPYPPKGSKHRYIFLILALDKELDLKPGVEYSEVLKAVRGHVIAYAKITCFYER